MVSDKVVSELVIQTAAKECDTVFAIIKATEVSVEKQ
jgi:molybdopterin-binding protein